MRRRLPELALFGPDRLGWRRLFLRVKRTAQLRTQTSEFDPNRTSDPTLRNFSTARVAARRARSFLRHPRLAQAFVAAG
jgi:hypothetical protein